MVNEEKLQMMVRLAAYEKEPAQKEIQEGGFYKVDYICSRLMVTILSYSIAYFLILVLLALYHFEYLSSALQMQEISSLVLAVAAIYILILLGCIFFAIIIYSNRYNQIQKRRREYYNELKQMEAFYGQNKEGGNG